MGTVWLTVTLREVVSFVLAGVGLVFFVYPRNYTYIFASLRGTDSQVSLLGLGLIAFGIYVFSKRPKFLEKAIS